MTGNKPANPLDPVNIQQLLEQLNQMHGNVPLSSVLPGSNIIGTCSCCGGPVCVPQMWGGVVPPVPTCAHCGATKRQGYGPVIPMQRQGGGSYGLTQRNNTTSWDAPSHQDYTT